MINTNKQKEYFDIIKNILLKYKNLDYSEIKKITYSFLIRLGVPIEEQDKNIIYLFDMWVNNFKDIDNIIVKYDPNWKGFCQFENNREKVKTDTAIKLYIPTDSSHIYEGANQLFVFLSNQNISHISKIRNRITFDNVVVRVNSIEDAEKITEYVNCNDYIKCGLIEANPFFINHRGITHSMDGNSLSSNGVFCDFITSYFINKINSDSLNNASLYDFQNNLINIDCDNKINNCDPNDERNNILKLMLMTINNERSTYDNFKKYVSIRKEQSLKNINMENILDEAIYILCNKYGKSIAIEHLSSYLKTGDFTKFSRENNSREKVRIYLNKELCNSIINKKHGDIKGYIDYIIDQYNEEEKMSILEQVSIYTYKKYNYISPGQLREALKQVINNNNYSYFTNDFNGREMLKIRVKSEDIIKLIRKQLIKDNIINEKEEINDLIALYIKNIKYKLTKKEDNNGIYK